MSGGTPLALLTQPHRLVLEAQFELDTTLMAHRLRPLPHRRIDCSADCSWDWYILEVV